MERQKLSPREPPVVTKRELQFPPQERVQVTVIMDGQPFPVVQESAQLGDVQRARVPFTGRDPVLHCHHAVAAPA